MVARAPAKDLAVLEVDRLPGEVRALPVAGAAAAPGAKAYSVGGSGVADALLWRLTVGTVRGRSQRSVERRGGPATAMVLETDAPVNPGDSGGPVVNERGHVVGVVAHFQQSQRAVSGNIDAEEVRALLQEVAPDAGWSWATGGAEPAADDLPTLTAALAGPPAGRGLAAAGLAAMGEAARPATTALWNAVAGADPATAAAVAAALRRLAGMPDPAALPVVITGLSGSPDVRLLAAEVFARQAAPAEAVAPLVRLLEDPAALTRKTAVLALGRFGPGCKTQALPALFKATGDPDPAVRESALDLIRDGDWVEALTTDDIRTVRAALARPETRAMAAQVLAPLEPAAADALADFLPLLNDVAPAVQAAALEGLARWGREAAAATPATRRLCDAPKAKVRAAAVLAYGKLAVAADVKAALSVRLDTEPDINVRQNVEAALAGLDLSAPGDRPLLDRLVATATAEPALELVFKRLTGRPDAVAVAEPAFSRVDARTRTEVRVALFGLLARGDPPGRTAEVVCRWVGKKDAPSVRAAAVRAMEAIGPSRAGDVVALVGLLTDPTAVAAAADLLGRYGPKAAGPDAAVALIAAADRLPDEARGRLIPSAALLTNDAALRSLRRRLPGAHEQLRGLTPEQTRWALEVANRIDYLRVSPSERLATRDVLHAVRLNRNRAGEIELATAAIKRISAANEGRRSP